MDDILMYQKLFGNPIQPYLVQSNQIAVPKIATATTRMFSNLTPAHIVALVVIVIVVAIAYYYLSRSIVNDLKQQEIAEDGAKKLPLQNEGRKIEPAKLPVPAPQAAPAKIEKPFRESFNWEDTGSENNYQTPINHIKEAYIEMEHRLSQNG